jgi:nucleolar pre-ribosomal-associated protein 1
MINRRLQSILQHPKLFKLCETLESGHSVRKDAIIHLIYVLFNTHPFNTCQPTHVEPLVQIYGGTCSMSDRKLLSIFQLFEQHRKVSVASIVSRWSPSRNMPSSNALDAVHNLDSAKVLRTCLSFPNWRRLSDLAQERINVFDEQLYDPVFLILLFARMLSENPPTSAFTWVELFRTNIVGLLIRCMSCKDEHIRELALCQIVALWCCLEVTTIIVLFLLNVPQL